MGSSPSCRHQLRKVRGIGCYFVLGKMALIVVVVVVHWMETCKALVRARGWIWGRAGYWVAMVD